MALLGQGKRPVLRKGLVPVIRIRRCTATTLLIGTSAGYAEEGDNLREAAQNPIGDLISVPFQNNTNFGIGHSDHTQNVLNIQPVYPVHLNPDSEPHSTRPILPVIYQPPFFSGRELRTLEEKFGPDIGDTEFGLGDLTPELFFSPKKPIQLAPERVWSGVLGQPFSFQPPLTISLGQENGPPDRGLSSSCLTSR